MAESKRADVIGLPLDRIDGRLKVTGRATYAFEYATQGSVAYGVIVSAAIGKGRILRIDTRDAQHAPRVLLVLTKDNAPPQTPWGPVDLPDRFARAEPALDTDEVLYFGFPVAFVVAETFEQATAAAAMVRIQYDPMPGDYDLHAAGPSAENPGRIDGNGPADSAVGDFESAFASAPVQIDAHYTTPHQHQAPMEPHATMAAWEGEMLTVHTSAQLTTSPQEGLARTFNTPKENVRIITRYVGGGFGSKLPYYVDATLAAIGARTLGRPVKVAMTRPQVFYTTTHRTASEQHVRLGADRDGRLTAYGQEALVHCARFDLFTEPVCDAARRLYAAPNRLTRHRRAKLDLPRSDSMRAPGEAIGLLGLECAMDELAEALDLDPVELRLRNDTSSDPEQDRPFASRHLAEALREGAARFGWNKRVAKPASVRDRRWLVGLGVASAIRGDILQSATARARLENDGKITIELAMTDIGTGSYTILTQIAADTMELPVDRVTVRLGDTRFPPTAGSGGSFGAATSGSAVLAACRKLKAGLASGMTESLGSVTPADLDEAYSHAGFGAHFAEVCVDRDTGEVRVRRMLGVFAAGRILNAKTARSQMIGGMTWGIGSALLEENHVDSRFGSFINQDLANYHVAVNADVGAMEVVFLDEADPHGGPLGSKGVGELGICGAGAAIMNAIHNATGARIRDFPATPDKLLATLETLDP
ncbi:xanthine dehydrogenase family protein molybdopterin-binding subunit [Mesorhizobium escarrei]|uniref:Aldehyde dehydrogenase: molybdenum cofactor-binding subunit n=1 Tax=Mesorhizobium escarrei TaxID=666018 RepID=A0ABN8JDW3_9HYPH|nr:xanthine dehydrogenase family protein molybdopterin-binding subunit [Mesorhizobium escarrei]CAH2395674.1 aldehyde dehydrogenase: molybdenum cofactor-binding subunit [Mesorhizobium escarrei]